MYAPPNTIIGLAEIFKEDAEIDEKQLTEYADYIRNEGLQLTKLVDDIIGLDSFE
ncbi:MAG: hypothetical protein ABR936_10225 [Bacteroidota bacterium]